MLTVQSFSSNLHNCIEVHYLWTIVKMKAKYCIEVQYILTTVWHHNVITWKHSAALAFVSETIAQLLLLKGTQWCTVSKFLVAKSPGEIWHLIQGVFCGVYIVLMLVVLHHCVRVQQPAGDNRCLLDFVIHGSIFL